MRSGFVRLAHDGATLALLSAVLLCPVATVVAADWVDHLSLLYWVTLGGIVAGVALARLPVSGAVAQPLGLLGGGAVVFYVVGSTLPRAPEGVARLLMLWGRLVRWVVIVQRGGFGNEPVLFVLLLAEIAFVIGFLAAWSVHRDRTATWPLVAGGTALVVNVSHAPETVGYVIPFVVASLLLVARLNLDRREAAWREAGLRRSSDVLAGTLRAGLALALLIAGVGWLAPEIPPQQSMYDSISQATQPVRDFQNEFNRAFGGIRGRGAPALSLSGFGNSLTLGGSFRLASYPVLRVTSPEPHYWRAVVYERYTGQGWTTSGQARGYRLPSGARLVGQPFEQRQEINQVVEVLQPRGSYLVAANQPVAVDMPVSAEALGRLGGRPGPSSGASSPSADVVSLRASPSPGSRYTVTSSVSRATPAMLRQAGRAVPADVQARYTQLPEVPKRVGDLALNLTRAYDNPYDKARAIELYLRTFDYSLDVAPPPADRDAVDYFLFDLKTGYCDYFASAMAVMLRSVGIPARVASGYTSGAPDAGGAYVVRDDNAHSWVEVYFPRYGWIEFDPTPAQPLVQHPAGVAEPTPTPAPPTPEVAPTPAGGETATTEDTPGSSWTGPAATDDGLPGGLRAAGALLAVAVLAVGMMVALWRAALADLPPAAAAYARVVQLASLLGWQPSRAETPSEFARRLALLAPRQERALRLIAESFAAFRFGHRPPSPGDVPILAVAWRSVRRGLFGAAARRVRAALTPWRR